MQNIKKTFNFKFVTFHSRQGRAGFTTIELLVVISVLSVIGSIIGSIVFSSFKGSFKSTTINDVRQNGNYAMIQMSKMIREATILDTPIVCTSGVSLDSISFTSLDGKKTTFSCIGPLYILASNSAELVNRSIVKIDSCSFTCSQDSIVAPPVIGINLQLSQEGPQFFVEREATIPFTTQVTMRNFQE